MKLLIADNDSDDRKLIYSFVSDLFPQVIVVENGKSAWRALSAENPPRIAILDWEIPRLTGPEICQRIRRNRDLPYIYTILLTKRESRDDMLAGMQSGADDYLTKPIDKEILRSRLIVAKRIIESIPPAEWAMPKVPGYGIMELLGKGACGSVWRATQLETHRPVALKLVRADLVTETVFSRVANEIELSRQLDHKYIAKVYDSQVTSSLCYYAMELVEGADLGEYISNNKDNLKKLLVMMLKICSGVSHAHAQGIVHRDLKPANVLITPEGDPRIVDFGVAKSILDGQSANDDDSPAGANEALGTPIFMSPEQALGLNERIDARCDVYALGVTMYIILAHRHPISLDRKNRWTMLKSIVDEPVRPPSQFRPDINPELERIVMKSLEKDPDARYQTAGFLGKALRQFLESKKPIGIS